CQPHQGHSTRRTSPFWEGLVTAWRFSSLQFLQRQVHRRSRRPSTKLSCWTGFYPKSDPVSGSSATTRHSDLLLDALQAGALREFRFSESPAFLSPGCPCETSLDSRRPVRLRFGYELDDLSTQFKNFSDSVFASVRPGRQEPVVPGRSFPRELDLG